MVQPGGGFALAHVAAARTGRKTRLAGDVEARVPDEPDRARGEP